MSGSRSAIAVIAANFWTRVEMVIMRPTPRALAGGIAPALRPRLLGGEITVRLRHDLPDLREHLMQRIIAHRRTRPVADRISLREDRFVRRGERSRRRHPALAIACDHRQ